MVLAKGKPNPRKRAVVLVFGVVLVEEGPTPENEHNGSFSGGKESPTPENERSCSFAGWCWQEEGPTSENERSCSFSGGVGGGAGQRKVQPPKTSTTARFQGDVGGGGGGCQGGVNLPENEANARFRGLWLPVRGQTPRKRARWLVFGGL